jgi:hypothetical protein
MVIVRSRVCSLPRPACRRPCLPSKGERVSNRRGSAWSRTDVRQHLLAESRLLLKAETSCLVDFATQVRC